MTKYSDKVKAHRKRINTFTDEEKEKLELFKEARKKAMKGKGGNYG